MRWEGHRESENVEDRRGRGPIARRGAAIGGGGLLLALLFALITGRNPMEFIDAGGGPVDQGAPYDGGPQGSTGAPGDEAGKFASVILGSTEDVWNQVFQKMGRRYEAPTLVLFENEVESACGYTTSAVGPFYCGADRQVYIDLSFYRDLAQRFGAPGDFAQAYVLAHEIGHHVQNLLGIERKVRQAQQQDPSQQNELSVRMELQADCFAGVWGAAFQRKGGLEQGDLEEGMRAAAAVGDDRIQKMSQGYVNPEGFTHGTSEQRQRWFNQGFRTGDPKQCDTFGARSL